MPCVEVGQENSGSIEPYCENHAVRGDDDRVIPFPKNGQRLRGIAKDCRRSPPAAVRAQSAGRTQTK
jgi:hypothetical protein